MSITKRPNRIHCLSSIRTISISWVVAGHVLALFLDSDNLVSTLDNFVYILNDAFVTAYTAVDTFFFISGLLVGYIFFRSVTKNPKSVKSPAFWCLYYIHRYIRLSPPYFFFIAFATVISDYVTFGPILFHEMVNAGPCKTEWWSNVLYINKMYANFQCLTHTWYLAADMQMYIFAPLLLIPLLFTPVIGVFLIILFAGINYVVYAKYDLPADVYCNYRKKLIHYDNLVYYSVWNRCTPYLIGIYTGYFLFKTKNKKLHLHWAYIILLWIASFLAACGCVYGLYDYLQGPSHKISNFASASYSYWSRIGWALAIAWVVVACEKNWAGPIKNFLEQGLWLPFDRLTYCIYLTHAITLPLIYAIDGRPILYVSTHYAVSLWKKHS
ncbi:unnamed protein product [Enterobius vermicularis]|uniref:Acyl_transf_3 domain-containing protein n=1 Tax=Enterobius vermicularis TaxID=51028 RepID=A0A0N4V530_ENTVE|nr:unnamed protein product [Enterobius vermicularis]